MEPTKHDITVFIEGLRRNNLSAIEIYRHIHTAWGDVITISERRVRKIVQEFANGSRTSFDRTRGSGRPKSDKRTLLIDQVDDEITEDPHLSSRMLAFVLNCSPSMIYRILTEDLELMPICDRYVPHSLTDVHKENRVTCIFYTYSIQHILLTPTFWIDSCFRS